MLLLWWWGGMARALCPEDPSGDLRGAAREVLVSFDVADPARLDRARMRLTALLPCVAQPAAETLGDVHRAMALLAHVDRDRRAAVHAWAAVRHHDPVAEPRAERFPPTHGVWSAFEASADLDCAERRLPSIRHVRWVVDGVPTKTTPLCRAFLLTAQSRSTLVYAKYHYRPLDLATLDVHALSPPKSRVRASLGITGGALVASGAGIALSGAFLERQALGTEPLAPGRVEVLGSRANRRYAAGSSVAAAGALALALGLAYRR